MKIYTAAMLCDIARKKSQQSQSQKQQQHLFANTKTAVFEHTVAFAAASSQ